MDVCKAPARDDHEGPEWNRLTSPKRAAADRYWNTYGPKQQEAREVREEKRQALAEQRAERRAQSVALLDSGLSAREVAAKLGVKVARVWDARRRAAA